MFALDLFNTKYERELKEGAVDNLEARRIDNLNMQMLELLDRAKEPAYKKNPAALAGLKKQFQKIKAERDSYFKINPATGMDPTGSLGTTKGKLDEQHDSPVASAITRRILMQRPDLLKQYGPELVGAAIDNVADYVGDVEEIGSSDVSAYVAQVERMLKENPPEAFAEGWKEESQDLEDWSKEVNMRLYRAHPSQRLALGKQLSNIEHKHFGSEIELFKNGKQGYTRIVSAALKALQSGDMVHYDPGKVGAMPFGSIVGDDAREIAAANLHASESEGYGILKRNRIVDTVNDFLRLVDVVRTLPQEYLFKYKDAGGQAWFEIVKDIGWSKDDAPGKKYRVSQGVAEDQDNPYGYRKGQTVKLDNGTQGRVIDIFDDSIEVLLVGGRTVTVDFRNAQVISEQGIAEGMERAVDAHGRTQTQWAQLVKSKFPDAKITQAKMIDGPMQATLPDGRKIGWSKVEQGIAEEKNPYGDYPQSPRAFGAGNFQRIVRANMGNLPSVTLEFPKPKDNINLDKKGLELISDYYDSLENDSLKNHFIYRVLPSADEILTVLKRLGWNQAVQPELPGIPTQGELPLQEKKKFDSNSDVTAGDTKVARELQKLRGQYPAAKSDVEAVAKSEIDSNERSQQQLSAIKGANTEQDRLLQQLVALDKKQGTEIGSLDNENDRLEQQLAQVEKTNARLAQTIGQMGGQAQSDGNNNASGSRTINLIPNAPADAEPTPAQPQTQPAVAAQAEPEQKFKSKSNAIAQMAQNLSQPRRVQGVSQGPAPSIRGMAANDNDQQIAVGQNESAEKGQRLHPGDPIVVTAPNEFEGKTGEIYDFSPSGSFVIVDLYNHGKHSMHLSDVAYNDHADQEEEDDWYDEDVAEGKKKRKKKSSKSMGGYFFPGYAYYGGGESGEGGGDGGGESINHRVAETALNSKDPQGDYAAKRRALQDLSMNKDVDQAAVLQRRLDLDREAKVKGVTEVAPPGAKAERMVKHIKKSLSKDGRLSDKDKAIAYATTWKAHNDGKVEEAQTDYQKRRQRERDVDAGRPVKPVPKNPQTDYAKKRAKDRKDMEMGEGLGDYERREFKRQELQHELGHERNNIAIAINGKTWKVVPGKGYADSAEERAYLQGMQRWAEKKSATSGKKWTVHLTGANPTVNELSTEKLAQYKTAAALDAGAADKAGNYERGDKRFAGIVKATKKQFANDVKKHKDQGVEEGWKDKLAGAALAGTMALGAAGANARVMPGDDPNINRLTGKPIATQQATDNVPAKAEAPKGFSKEYLQKAADPNRFGRYMISVEKAQELLNSMQEGVEEGWKDVVAGSAMALGAIGAGAQTMPDINAQQVELANKYYNVLIQRAKEDGRELDTRTLNVLKAKAQDAAAKKTQQSSQQQGFPSQGSERKVAKDAGQFESQGVAEGLMKEPTTRKEYLDQRDKLFRMMAVDSNPANKQIIKQALQDLEARYGNLKNAVKEESSTASEAVERAILNRIMVAHTDLLMKFGPDKVMQAAEEVAYNVGDVDEIGTSDVSAYVNQVRQILGA